MVQNCSIQEKAVALRAAKTAHTEHTTLQDCLRSTRVA
jgi:hypothetical protein